MGEDAVAVPPGEGSRRAALRRALAARFDVDMLAYWPRAFSGDWRDVMEDEGCELLARATLMLARNGDRAPWPLAHQAWAGRRLSLTCYGKVEAAFYDFVLRDLAGQTARAAFILCQDLLLLLDNSSAPIHEFNLLHPPELSTEAEAIEYLRMFCWVICGDNGPFQIIEDTRELPFMPAGEAGGALPEVSPAKPAARRPPEPEKPANAEPAPGGDAGALPDGADILTANEDPVTFFERLRQATPPPPPQWLIRATVHYETALFASEFAVFASGAVEMIDDERVAEVLRRPVWRVAPPLRYHLPAELLEA